MYCTCEDRKGGVRTFTYSEIFMVKSAHLTVSHEDANNRIDHEHILCFEVLLTMSKSKKGRSNDLLWSHIDRWLFWKLLEGEPIERIWYELMKSQNKPSPMYSRINKFRSILSVHCFGYSEFDLITKQFILEWSLILIFWMQFMPIFDLLNAINQLYRSLRCFIVTNAIHYTLEIQLLTTIFEYDSTCCACNTFYRFHYPLDTKKFHYNNYRNRFF